MDNRQFYHGSNHVYNTPSPVIFPSASPTPKLYSTPTKKLPEVKQWQGAGSVPHNKYDDAIIHNGEEEYQNHNYNHFNSREKSAGIITPTISPLSMMMESDTILDDEDISSYRFNEEDYLSSILSSRSPSLHRRPVSFSSPSPHQQEERIVGNPYAPAPNQDPIKERPRRFSFESSIPAKEDIVVIATTSTKIGSFGKNFMSRMKKVTKPFK